MKVLEIGGCCAGVPARLADLLGTQPDGYRVLDKNAAETVATVEGEPGDALRFATITLANLQAFVVKLAEIATPETEIDLYLDWLTIIGRPVSGDGKKMVFVAGMIVEETPDDPDGNPAAERGTSDCSHD